MAELGPYAEKFAYLIAAMGSAATDEQKWDVFETGVQEAASYIRAGLDKTLVVDELHAIAERTGMARYRGEDELQFTLSEILGEIEPDEVVPDLGERDNESPAPKPNGKTQHAPAKPKPAHATVYDFPDPATIPPRAWLYGGHYVRGAVTATVAPGGTGKTTLSLFEAITMAQAGLHVWYISGEDPKVEIDRRIAAHIQLHGCDRAQLAGNLFVDDKATFPIKITKPGHGTAVTFDEEWLAAFRGAIERDRIDVVIFDPLVSFHSVSENDNSAMDQIVKRLSDICAACGCCIEASHHVRKPSLLTAEITVDDARGGGALVNATRSCRVINRMSKELAQQAHIPLDKRATYLRLDPGKRNMAPPEHASWWRLVSVVIGNGVDNVQAIERYTFPNAMDGLTPDDVESFRKLVKEREWQASSQGVEWLGLHLIARLNLDKTNPGDIKRVNLILSKWEANQVFKKVQMVNPVSRKPNIYFVATDFEVPADRVPRAKGKQPDREAENVLPFDNPEDADE